MGEQLRRLITREPGEGSGMNLGAGHNLYRYLHLNTQRYIIFVKR